MSDTCTKCGAIFYQECMCKLVKLGEAVFTPDYDTYTTRPDEYSGDDEWVEYANHLQTMCKLHESKIKTLEAQCSTLRVENMHLKVDLEHFRRGKW